MHNLVKIVFFFIFIGIFCGCSPKNRYDIDSDVVISDLSLRIKSLDEDMTTLKSELDQVKVVLGDKDIATDLRASIRKEIHEGEKYIKEIDQWLAYLKVQQKQRYKSLYDRKESPELIEEAKSEIEAYFLQKKLKPITPTWKERYRTAIEL